MNGSVNSKQTRLASLLLDEGLCTSVDEATAMADMIMDDVGGDNIDFGADKDASKRFQKCLQEQFELSSLEALDFTIKLWGETAGQDVVPVEDDNDDKLQCQHENDTNNAEDEEDGVALFDGECELCDRYIQLTKHHFIPKSTWPRMETRLMHATKALEEGENIKAGTILGPGLVHLVEDLATAAATNDKKSMVRHILRRTGNVCRPCHSALHKAHDNMELALSYATIELLLQDQQVAKFCKWASKQKAGKYAVT